MKPKTPQLNSQKFVLLRWTFAQRKICILSLFVYVEASLLFFLLLKLESGFNGRKHISSVTETQLEKNMSILFSRISISDSLAAAFPPGAHQKEKLENESFTKYKVIYVFYPCQKTQQTSLNKNKWQSNILCYFFLVFKNVHSHLNHFNGAQLEHFLIQAHCWAVRS